MAKSRNAIYGMVPLYRYRARYRVRPKIYPCVRGSGVMRGGRDAGFLRLLRPSPSAVQLVCLHSIDRRLHRAALELGGCPQSCATRSGCRPPCARSGGARAVSSSCWRCCPWRMAKPSTSRRVAMSVHMPSSCTSAAVLRLTTRGVAQPHSSQRVDQLKPEQPSSDTSTPLSARGRMCSQTVFRRDG